jgi:hypothetical protein
MEVPKFRTKPKGQDWVKLDSTGKRTIYFNDLDVAPGLRSPLVLPGTYTVVLQIGDQKMIQKLDVLKDPNTKASLDDIKKQHAFDMKLYASIQKGLKMVDEMETMRADILANVDKYPEAQKQRALKFEEDVYKLEAQLIDIMQTGTRWDSFRNPMQSLERIIAISKDVQVDGADYPPTTQHQQVFEIQNKKLEQVETQFKEIKEKRSVF